ncbi:MAG: 4Fe-4S dicluster domain-containing protein [bacterium]|nr:4Fe-4S dicluster domain-containing protein [bacterium]
MKFLAWFAFLALAFVLMRKGKVTPKVRKGLYLASILIFGVILGSDPSAMGTVKDAIVLFASRGVIFPPRMIALALFLLTASLFIYRPWCHLFCPFGLVGWLVEKISIFRIKVNYDSCIACEACSRACPSTVMEAILKREKTIPDCFSCGSCIEVCPSGSVSLDKGKRQVVPAGKFD